VAGASPGALEEERHVEILAAPDINVALDTGAGGLFGGLALARVRKGCASVPGLESLPLVAT